MGVEHSPLFVPALWEGSHFKVLDETVLPWEVRYLTVREPSEAVHAVREMKTRAFGQVLTFVYAAALAAKEPTSTSADALAIRLGHLTEQFAAARPTFDFRGLGRAFAEWFGEIPAGTRIESWIEAKALATAARMVAAREARARRAAELLPSPCRLLTHCNVSGELVAIARECGAMGKEIYVTATETRPYLQGSRLTAWELSRAGVKVTVIPDCAIAQVMAKGKVDAVLVGADRCARNGDVINKVGTYPLALLARERGLPFFALVQNPGSLDTGADVTIEERPTAELLTFRGRAVAGEGVGGLYPAFDVTPASLVSQLIGFDEASTPDEFRKKFGSGAPPSEPERRGDGRTSALLYGVPKPGDYAYLAQALKAEGIEAALVAEMRPHLWGARVVSREFVDRGMRATLIADNMMGSLFYQRRIKRLYLFCLSFKQSGPEGICGSLLAAELARAHRVPVELHEAEAQDLTAPDKDVATFLGEKVIPDGVSVYPIDTEIIPWSLFKEPQAVGL